MIVAIHQPNCFPWRGFFDKMRLADVFVLLDTVPFTKGGYQNRYQVKGPQGVHWLTVPVLTKGRLGQATCDVKVADNPVWRRKHQHALESFYGRAPFFAEMMRGISGLYSSDAERLVEFALPGIEWVKALLGIKATVVRASELDVKGTASDLLCNIVHRLGGATYLSGPSGRSYLDLAIFEQKSIEVRFHTFVPLAYAQSFGEFAPGVSTLDYLFSEGARQWW